MSQARKLLILSLASILAACQAPAPGGNEAGEAPDSANAVAPTNRTGSAGGGSGAQAQTIGAALGSTAELSSFAQAVQSAGLSETLAGAGPYTVFAPSNEALAANAPPQDRGQLTALLTGHIVPGTVTADDLRRAVERGEGGRAELATVAGTNLSIIRDGDGIVIDNGSGARARIVAADRILSNGVVHRIDAVIIPPAAPGAPPAAR